MSTAPTLEQLALAWQARPFVLAGLGTWMAAYALAAQRARRSPPGRTAAFAAGIAVLAFALEGGLDRYAESLLSVHVAQHLVLTMVAAPLLVAGAPVALVLRALGRPARLRLVAVLDSRAGRGLIHPGTAVAAFAAVTLAVHLPAVYQAALADPAWHAVEHGALLAAALLLWTAALGPAPLPHRLSGPGRLAVLMSAMPPMALVGAWLASTTAPRYAAYVPAGEALGRSPLADQQAAGALMWVGGTVPLAAIALGVAWSALRREQRRALVAEARADRSPGALRG